MMPLTPMPPVNTLGLFDLQILAREYAAADAALLRSAAASCTNKRSAAEELVAMRQRLKEKMKRELRARGCPEDAIQSATSIIILEGLKRRPRDAADESAAAGGSRSQEAETGEPPARPSS